MTVSVTTGARLARPLRLAPSANRVVPGRSDDGHRHGHGLTLALDRGWPGFVCSLALWTYVGFICCEGTPCAWYIVGSNRPAEAMGSS
jgi:hypothetical protein